MIFSDIPFHRLQQQRISQPIFKSLSDVVRWMGAMQAQDFAGVKWALALRMIGITDSAVEAAFNKGEFIRTHLMRPTWHLVAPEDLRWMLELTGKRVQNGSAGRYRQLGLEAKTLVRAVDVIARTLQGGQQCTRDQLRETLERAEIATEGQRLAHILSYAELASIICSGGRRGKQFTYALLDERVPAKSSFTREEALVTLVRRYFTSHGPATAKDFTWWSGLTQSDLKQALSLIGKDLIEVKIAEHVYWFAPVESIHREPSPTIHLLPPYDEYTIAYQNHAPTLNPAFLDAARRDLFGGTIIIDGQVTGYWRRTFQKNSVKIHFAPFRPLTSIESQAAWAAAQRWGDFLELQVES